MYSLTFYLLIFFLISLLITPFYLLGIAFIVYEYFQKRLEKIRGREERFKDINYLTSVFKDESSSSELLEEALAAFNTHFLHFGSMAKDSKEYQGCMDFISAFALCPNMDIDHVVRYRQDLTAANANYAKEIETIIGSALKNREDKKAKK